MTTFSMDYLYDGPMGIPKNRPYLIRRIYHHTRNGIVCWHRSYK